MNDWCPEHDTNNLDYRSWNLVPFAHEDHATDSLDFVFKEIQKAFVTNTLDHTAMQAFSFARDAIPAGRQWPVSSIRFGRDDENL
jgi:hypothetical protein